MGDAKQINRLLYFIYFLLVGDFLSCSARRIRKTCMSCCIHPLVDRLVLRGEMHSSLKNPSIVERMGATALSEEKSNEDSEMEIFSRHGVKIEPFDKSHVEMHLLEPVIKHKNKFHLQMEFKTHKPNGVLFYGRSRKQAGELIAITLQGGNLFYKVQCPTLHADLLVPAYNMTRLDDGKWHTISYSVKYRPFSQYGVLQIDGYSNSKRYEVTCKRITSIVIGGHSPKDDPYTRSLQFVPGHFDGCIRNLRLPSALRSPPKYYAVSVCE